MKTLLSAPYERIIQWAAGPVSIVSGFAATLLVTKVHFLGNLHLDKTTAAAQITKGLTFVVSAGVTYAAHHKWLDNLGKWWFVQDSLSADLAAPSTAARVEFEDKHQDLDEAEAEAA